ncbi:FecR domain-containing protein [Pseudomonas sp. PDM16]|uniref:FecR domain-containing protein n=1 Tax=Pseudomonas sp. PDM16 TaxID=2769292 RepID=UPI0017815679|nr:FecR domain-containing protein [Pseudomonas sp. PDM16]MBD9413516.1 FecR domain-containing protein [Pseudomonas sp. PDM16]
MKAVLGEAVDWYVRLHDSSANDNTRANWRAWLAADHRHAEAWARIEVLQRQLGQAPAGSGRTLERARHNRRDALKTLALLLGVGVVGWQGYRVSPWSADYVTRVGQRLQLTLADGSRLDLNTDTRVDIRFDAGQRLILLHHGEILVETAKDSRPLSVQTSAGRVLALGTRFGVREVDGATRVTVEEHAVEIHPLLAEGAVVRVEAGQSRDFSAGSVGELRALETSGSAWTRGMLVAVDWRLDDLLGELSRYRHGYLGCAPEVAAMRLSGAFNLNDGEAALASLQDALPIRVRRMSRYWVRIEPRGA